MNRLIQLALLFAVGAGAMEWTYPQQGIIQDSSTLAADTIVVSGIVVDELDRGVTSARVQIVYDGRVLAAATSAPDGTFRVRARLSGEAVPVLRVERLAYALQELPLDRRPSQEVRVELVPAPLPLPGLQVVGTRPACRSPDGPAAEEFWRAAAGRHVLDLDTLGIASYTLARTDTLVSPVGISAPHLDTELTRGQRGSAPLLRVSWDRRVEREGYAFPVRRTNRDGSYDSWSYAPLEADFSSHFLTERFSRWHHLYDLEPSTGGGFDVQFCPVDEERPGLRGRLRFSPDTVLVRAEWEFVTPDPDEGAGGWATFGGAVDAAGLRLLPDESLTWRMLPTGRMQRRAQWYEGWKLAPGDSVPFLPGR